MGKYLIQDIVPPEKKQRHVAVKRSTDTPHVISHPVHPIPHEPQHEHHPTLTPLGANPRTMVLDQIVHDDAPPVHAKKNSSKVTHELVSRIASWKGGSSEAKDEDEEDEVEDVREPIRFPAYANAGNDTRTRGPWIPWIVGLVVVAVIGVFVLNFFSGAKVIILPKHSTIPMIEKFTASKNPALGELPYAIMVATTSLSREVPATGEKTVVAKASGKIIIYNEQTTTQRLIKNTRFQSTSGKIYRINESLTVPKSVTKGGTSKPGSIEATVYADDAGPDYNSNPVDFTVPGLKGLPVYSKVYARSSGPLAGGASGVLKTVSDQDLKAATEDLRVQLETKLRAKARGDLATSQISFDDAIVVSIANPELSKSPASAENKAIVNATGAIYLVTFKRDDLVLAIMKAIVPPYNGEPVTIKNLDTFKFDMTSQKGDALLLGNKLDFTLRGTPDVTWVVDQGAVKKALVNLPQTSFIETMKQFPAVERAKPEVRPRWKQAFPEAVEKISVVLVDSMTE